MLLTNPVVVCVRIVLLVSLLLRSLHWFPTNQRIIYKLCSISFTSGIDKGPSTLSFLSRYLCSFLLGLRPFLVWCLSVIGNPRKEREKKKKRSAQSVRFYRHSCSIIPSGRYFYDCLFVWFLFFSLLFNVLFLSHNEQLRKMFRPLLHFVPWYKDVKFMAVSYTHLTLPTRRTV